MSASRVDVDGGSPPSNIAFKRPSIVTVKSKIHRIMAKFNILKIFKKKKSKANLLQQESYPSYYPQQGTPPSKELIASLPKAILQRIFAFVCPHTQDKTYETCEHSAIEDSCMLCDLRDLSHCAQVSRRWRAVASDVLYQSIRIDAVHYCEREDTLAEKRKRKRLSRNGEPEDTPSARLRLLCRTVRENQESFALHVQYLKIPYMTRETCKPDLARTINVLPNLRYVDLPEGFFMDDPSCNTLKQELQARCPDIRKMTYIGGAERSLELLANERMWSNLEVLELSKLNMDPTILRQALGSLPELRALKITDMVSFNNDLFKKSQFLPPFPPLTELIFENTPNLTVDGLTAYLSRRDTQNTLRTLSFTATGVIITTIHQIVASAPRLQHLSIIESVTTSFQAGAEVEPLSSQSLQTLHYEITSAASANSYANTTEGYYEYLTTSLVGGCMPNLEELYVRDPDFAEGLLVFAPPAPFFASDPDNFVPNRFSSNNPFAGHQTSSSLSSPSSSSSFPHFPLGLPQELQVYSKGLDEMEWNFSRVQPPSGRNRRGSATTPRPISSYGLTESTEKGWQQGGPGGGGVRRSVIVGNGFGGFLAVPEGGGYVPRPGSSGGRPSSSAGEKGHTRRGSQYDMWR